MKRVAQTQRWTFSLPTILGDVRASWELNAEGLRFHTDAPMNPINEMLRWDAIVQASTAVVDLPSDKSGSAAVRGSSRQLEWLLASRTDGKRAFMQALPNSEVRDAIVASMRQRLGSRWAGERLPLKNSHASSGASARGDGFKLFLIIASVPVLLLVLLYLFLLVSAVLWLPAAIALGGWLFHKGFVGFRDALHVANTPTAKVSSAAMGLVELKGRPVVERPTRAAASGLACVWWDLSVDVWEPGKKNESGRWCEMMSRHGGKLDTLLIEDATGRVPVWLRDADLLMREHTWENDKDVLPAAGVALLEGTDFSWGGTRRVRVRERRMEADGLLYVLGTLDEARHLPTTADEKGLARLARSVRSGEWRMDVVRAVPAVLRAPVAVTIGYLAMFTAGGDRERGLRLADAPPPTLDPHAVVVWKGRAGRPLTVSDKHEGEAISDLRKRSLWYIGGGIAVLCWVLNELIKLF